MASSIGLGTGLHTFLLYLGPFIAQVTLAAYECNSLDFPEPPYPDSIVCPEGKNETTIATTTAISILSIMSKVRLESFMWGAGTALGELPPYFMARAAALSGMRDEDDEELVEFEELLRKDTSELSLLDRLRIFVFRIIKRVGFWGILLCASIPNPLFDLAGITCGHFLVNFSTFFGATLIGKAIIKMHLQKLFVIIVFSEHHIDTLVDLLSFIPYVGSNMQPLFKEWLFKEKSKLHESKTHGAAGSSETLVSWILGKIVLLMIIFFIISIVNSLAQKYYKRVYLNHHSNKKKQHQNGKTTKEKLAND